MISPRPHLRRRLFAAVVAAVAAGATCSPPARAQDPSASPPPFSFPQDFDAYRMTSAFDLDRGDSRADWTGWTVGDPSAGNGHAYNNHSGSDFGMVTGTALHAIGDGTVTSALDTYPTDDHSGGGNYIFFRHESGEAVYAVNFWHLDYLGALKDAGDPVQRGEHVAWSDNTGNSTGPHLHYGIRRETSGGGSGRYSCPFYHGWWEADEFYSIDGRPCLAYLEVDPGVSLLNCREGASTGYEAITSLWPGGRFVASQRNGWWRIFIPVPPAAGCESRAADGSPGDGYSDTDSWSDDPAKSAARSEETDPDRVDLRGQGSRAIAIPATGPASAVFTVVAPQAGPWIVATTWPADANADAVRYRVTHGGGVDEYVLPQRGRGADGGAGTHAIPHLVAAAPYVVRHTTVRAESVWDEYSPAGAGVPEAGPERVYRLDLVHGGTVSATVDHTGYPALDVDVHLLGSADPADCLARGDWSLRADDLAPGTYYVVVDTYGADGSGATGYELRIDLDPREPVADAWVVLGEVSLARGEACSVEVDAAEAAGPFDPVRSGAVFADAVRLAPVAGRRSAFCSNSTSYIRRIDTATTPVPSVVVSADATAGNDGRDLADAGRYAAHAAPGAGAGTSSPVVASVLTGQRFVCSARTADGWYRVDLTNAAAAPEGWIYGEHLTVYHRSSIPVVASPNRFDLY